MQTGLLVFVGGEGTAEWLPAWLQLMDRANEWAKILELQNSVHFMMANATVSLESMLATYPGSLSLVTVQVPLLRCPLRALAQIATRLTQ